MINPRWRIQNFTFPATRDTTSHKLGDSSIATRKEVEKIGGGAHLIC
mgnify:FL=1|jgi:hypothetical protein